MALQSELFKYGMWVWFTLLAALEEGWEGGFLPFVLKKMVKRLIALEGFGFVGFLCVFPSILCCSLLPVLLCLSQHLCTCVPSHPLEQVGASMTDLKMEHCHGAGWSPASQGGAVPADVSQQCQGSFETIGDFQYQMDLLRNDHISLG